jgi:hypothetical protein
MKAQAAQGAAPLASAALTNQPGCYPGSIDNFAKFFRKFALPPSRCRERRKRQAFWIIRHGVFGDPLDKVGMRTDNGFSAGFTLD